MKLCFKIKSHRASSPLLRVNMPKDYLFLNHFYSTPVLNSKFDGTICNFITMIDKFEEFSIKFKIVTTQITSLLNTLHLLALSEAGLVNCLKIITNVN